MLLVACCLGGVLPSTPAGAAPDAAVIQPGSRITTGDGGVCTANWIYLGTGRLKGQQYVGTAGHCVDRVGEAVHLADNPFPLTAPGLMVGKVAYISKALDFSLIKIDRSNFKHVDASMAGHPDIPQRVGTDTDTSPGDTCQFSGHGVGFDGQQQTEQSRVGVLAFIGPDQQYCNGPVTNGDSGGPVADTTAGNAAIGIVATLGVAVFGDTVAAGEGGPTLTAILADAAKHSLPIRLRTV
jgi:hypothetical protein